jgi:hypothetical protein
VGQNDAAALAMMIMSALSIAAQHPPVGSQAARFYLLDGSPVDSSLTGRLGQLAEIIPHPVTNVTWRDVAETFTELAAEVKRRQEDASGDVAPLFLFIYDIQRFRDLRKSDDDFGFSRYDEDKPAPPSKLFGDILRDGPPTGVHTVIWCDSVNNLNRTLDRQGMKEFENRILFQMSANDSSTLIDSPAASKLGENRALYYSEEENRIEKFRPYGLPEPAWLDGVKRRFAARPRPEVPIQASGDGAPAAGVETVPVGAGAATDGNGPAPGADGPDRLVESHAPAMDELGGPTIETL